MSKAVLTPVVERVELGFKRTTCGCRQCTINCEHMPGFLLPDDVPRVAVAVGYDPDDPRSIVLFAAEHLIASGGFTVGIQTSEGPKLLQLPTLTPARKPDGSCTFLTPDKRCAIHAAAPYGCAFFDEHMSDEEGNRRSTAAAHQVFAAHAAVSLYSSLVGFLRDELKRVAPPVREVRERLRVAREQEGLGDPALARPK